MKYFDNDYMAGAHPEVMKRLTETNLEMTVGYGLDHYCEEARQLIRQACAAPEALVHFLVGGTQTNATVLDTLLQSHEGVLAADSGHINVHESGAIEAGGHKVIALPAQFGKVSVETVSQYLLNFYRDDTYEHMVAPGVLYITQPTELGTLYTLSELQALSDFTHANGLRLYVDGARLGYALSSPAANFTLKDIAQLSDVFYIGGTKCGALFGEAVVAAHPQTLPHFFPIVKQHGALLAKGRLLGLEFSTLFQDNLYTRIAQNAVNLALRLRDAFARNGFQPAWESYTNQQFFILPNILIDNLLQYVSFEYWGPKGEQDSTVRFVTSWATRPEDVEEVEHQLAAWSK